MNNEELLEYYDRELTWLREKGAAFAAEYPKVAARLELGVDECPDPHVERLIEAFAFLTSRIQYNLESELPKLTNAFLGILFPHLVNPIPSMAVAKFTPDPDAGKLTGGYTIEKETPIFTKAREGKVCRYRTCYPVDLWPLEVSEAVIESKDKYKFLDTTQGVAAVLRLRLKCLGASFEDLECKRLRFYLNGHRMVIYKLYELLLANLHSVALLPENRKDPIILRENPVLPVGFRKEEAALPRSPNTSPCYGLVQEYFAFPQKFLFFDLDHMDMARSGRVMDVLFLLDTPPDDNVVVGPDTFLLGCAPVINLFEKILEPLTLDHRKSQYRLIPDGRLERTTEIYSLLSVSSSGGAEAKRKIYEPFFSYNHHQERAGKNTYWTAERRHSVRADMPGTDMYLSFTDLDLNPRVSGGETVKIRALCTNRMLAENVPPGAEFMIELAAPLAHITLPEKPVLPVYPSLGGSGLWKLVSHLSLNYLSLKEGEDGLKALKEILTLYAFTNSPSIQREISGIREMKCREAVHRTGRDAWRGFCRGTEITLRFDQTGFKGGSAILLASVLNHFFALYATINSFTQVTAKRIGREDEWKKWPPMTGEKFIL